MTQEQRDRNIRLAEALESGKYTQVKNTLRTKDGHCCLGVACELAKDELGIEWGEYDAAMEAFQIVGHIISPPILVFKYYGWAPDGPSIEAEGVVKNAAMHNDGGGAIAHKSFAQIAQGFRKLAEA